MRKEQIITTNNNQMEEKGMKRLFTVRQTYIGIRFSLRLILILIGIAHRENFSLIRGV